jgi:hypothetical protein
MLARISRQLRSVPVASQADRDRRRRTYEPAAEHVEEALQHMKQAGTDPVGARTECCAALELLGEHHALETVVTDLSDVAEERARYVP